MATYQELLDAIARVGAATGDSHAWMSGLLGADLAVVTSPASVVAPHAIDAVVAKIRAAHRHVFDSPPPPAPSATAPEQAQGSAAEAIRAAETSLALQNSTSAQLDLQVITAVLNAHTTDTAGRAALDGLQRDIENAVATRTDLDTPAGARAFQRYLIDRLRDIKTVVETAGLDATSKASLAAALASLYAATTPGSGDDAQPARTPPERPAATPEPQMPAGPGADPFLDTLPGADDLSAPPTAVPAGPPPTPAPMVAPVPPLPAAGGTVSPATLPSVPAGMPAAVDGPAPMRLPGNGDTDAFDGALLDEPLDEDDPAERDNEPDTAEEEPGPPPNTGPTVVDLPDGDTVTAPTPQLAAAITAAVAGTPVAEAFRQQGITIPAPGTAVAHPVEPAKTRPGDIGMLTDRHALALGHGKAVLDNRIQPIASVAGPSFLGWEHPPEPGSAPTTTPTPDQPAPTRPAVTAGPPAIGE